jgi:hypothetical protein
MGENDIVDQKVSDSNLSSISKQINKVNQN